MTDLILYTHPMSSGRIVRWLLEEIGVAYRVEVIDITSDFRPPAFLAINPIGKVPVLRHGSAVISETGAICAYLADAFPAAGLAPPSATAARGEYYRWLFFAAGPMDTATTLSSMDFTLPPYGDARAPWGSLDRVIEALDTTLQARQWLSGDGFSAADVFLGSLLDWAVRFGTIAERPSFAAYLDRLNSRPAQIRAAAMDDALAGRPVLTRVG
ncbi:MAG: glutathione S-transferase family protein [Polymorphobacter sp.]